MLSERQARIISACYHQADHSAFEIAQQLNLKEHTVRREIEKLSSDGIIRRQAFIDIYRLGFIQYELYLSLGAQRPSAVKKFLDFVLASERVAWVGQFSGAYQYVLTVCCRHPTEIRDFISNLGQRAGIALTDRQLGIRLGYTEFGLKMFSDDQTSSSHIHFGVPGQITIDDLDHRILQEISRSNAPGNNLLASKLKISPSTCHARLARLRELGILVASTLVVDFSRLNFQAYSLLITTRTHSEKLTAALHRFCAQHKSIVFLVENIGAFDYKIGVLLNKPSDIVALNQQISDALGEELVLCSCLTAFDYLKVARYPFQNFPFRVA